MLRFKPIKTATRPNTKCQTCPAILPEHGNFWDCSYLRPGTIYNLAVCAACADNPPDPDRPVIESKAESPHPNHKNATTDHAAPSELIERIQKLEELNQDLTDDLKAVSADLAAMTKILTSSGFILRSIDGEQVRPKGLQRFVISKIPKENEN